MIRDMELLLNSVYNDEIKEYMNEALRCYNAGSYRACVVLSVIAGMQDLRNKINSVASSNSNIKQLDDDLSKKEQELQTFEKTMIERCATEKIGILSADEAKMLKIYLDIRNQCAHPGAHTSSAEEARNVFSGIIDILCSKKSLIGTNQKKFFIMQLEQKCFYPYAKKEIYENITKEKTQNIHQFAILPIYKEVVKTLTEYHEIQEKEFKIHNFLVFLAYLPKYKDFNINDGLNTLITHDQYIDFILTILKYNVSIITKLDTTNRISIISKIENCIESSTGIDVRELIEELFRDNTVLKSDERTGLLHAMNVNDDIDNLNLVKKLIDEEYLSAKERKLYSQYMKESIEDYDFQYLTTSGEKYFAFEDLVVVLNDNELIEKLIDKVIKDIDVYCFYKTNYILDHIIINLSDPVFEQISNNQYLKLIKNILIRSRENANSAIDIHNGKNEMYGLFIDKLVEILLESNESLNNVIEYFKFYSDSLGEIIYNNRPDAIHQIVFKVYDEHWKFNNSKMFERYIQIVEQKENLLDTTDMIMEMKDNENDYIISK